MKARLHAAALRSLAAACRSSGGVLDALSRWPDEAPREMRPALVGLTRRIRLGATPAAATAAMGDALPQEIGPILETAAVVGTDAAEMLEDAAAALFEREYQRASSAGAASGARLSGRMIAALPVLVLPLLPMARAPLFDAVGLLTVTGGIGLALAGTVWLGRLIPRWPSADDADVTLADIAARHLAAGADIDAALHGAADALEEVGPVAAAQRRVRLGATWPEALAVQGGDLVRLAQTIEAALRNGTPLRAALKGYVAERRRQRVQTFEEKVRKAPVLMILPLVVCVLPSFILLALVPFLRGLSLGA